MWKKNQSGMACAKDHVGELFYIFHLVNLAKIKICPFHVTMQGDCECFAMPDSISFLWCTYTRFNWTPEIKLLLDCAQILVISWNSSLIVHVLIQLQPKILFLSNIKSCDPHKKDTENSGNIFVLMYFSP